ncbi:MAG: hypothetical protein Q9161_009756 [Pseudevernia consocians]
MSDKSAKVAVKTLYKHYAQNEKTLFREFRPYMIKSTRIVTTLKRGMEGEIIRILQAYDDDGLIVIEDCSFIKDLISGKNYTAEEKAIGLTEPRPDLTYVKICVHWFKKLKDDTEIFQMTRIRGYQMEDEKDLPEMRKDLHNILNWGLFEWRLAAEDVWKKILARA